MKGQKLVCLDLRGAGALLPDGESRRGVRVGVRARRSAGDGGKGKGIICDGRDESRQGEGGGGEEVGRQGIMGGLLRAD